MEGAIPASFVTADRARLAWPAYLSLILLCAAFFLPGIVTLPPTDRDESSFAQATKQMIETGNYVDIRLQDKPRYKKPIGIYWLQAASVKLFDADHLNEIWAYRLPSLLGATIAVLMTAALGALLFGPTAGILAAMMMAGCVLLNVEARLAKTDAALLASIMAAQYALARAYLGINMSWRMAFLFWTALGIGILIKGPIILLVLISTLLWLYCSEKHLRWLAALKPLIGIPYLILIVAPWFVAILMQSHGAFLQQSAGQDMLAKLWQGQNRGILPPGLHLLVFPVIFFPFAVLALIAAPGAWRDRIDPAVRFCLGWIIPTWVVFELSLTKLPHYVLPAYPAIAILAARAFAQNVPVFLGKNSRPVLMTAAVALYLMTGAGFAVVFGLLPYFSDHAWNYNQLGAGLLLVVGQSFGLLLFLQRQKIESMIVLTASSLVFMVCVFGNTLPGLEHIWMSRQVAQIARAAAPCGETRIVSAAYGEPSLVFLAGTGTKIFGGGEQAAEALKEDRCLVAAIDDKRKEAFLNAFTGSAHPSEIGIAEGLNSGKGHATEITLYVMPWTGAR